MERRAELVAQIKAISDRLRAGMAVAFETEAGPLLDELLALKDAELAERDRAYFAAHPATT